jgi:hypothetical protein
VNGGRGVDTLDFQQAFDTAVINQDGGVTTVSFDDGSVVAAINVEFLRFGVGGAAPLPVEDLVGL